jgi:hypothetical protein
LSVALKGSCLCGAVRYEAERLATPIGNCHCNVCRKAQGAAYASTARVVRSDFRWTSGEDRLTAFASSAGKLRRFCSVCGSHMISEWVAEPQVVVRVATLDDDPGVRPSLHIFVGDEVAWLVDEPDAPRYAERPPVR